ncbi:MAG: hypothetical protein H6746_01740 [Deltaproteobacteria bacterium]|nr:hypothetical protein [Deltaproteobacteria bacterium]
MYSEVLEMSPREDELSWFPVLQRGLRAMKRRAPLTDEQAQLVRIGAFFAAEVARELLACDDLDDFTARLDHVTSRRWFLAARVLLARAVVRLGPPLLSEMDDEFEASRPGAFLVEVLGPGVALEAARAERLLVAYTREMPGLLPVAPDEPFDVDTVRHLAFSITVPAPIRQAVQGSPLRTDALDAASPTVTHGTASEGAAPPPPRAV